MKRSIGLLVGIATVGLLSMQCSSDDDPGTPTGGSTFGGGGAAAGTPAGGAPAAGAPMAGVAGAAPMAGKGGTGAGGATGGSAGKGGGAGMGGAVGGSSSGGASAGRSGGGGSAGASGGAAGAAGAAGKGGSGGSAGGSGGGGGKAGTFAEVTQILTMQCAKSNCHNEPSMHNNLTMNGLYGRLTTPMTEGDCKGTTLVMPNNAADSFLAKVIQGASKCGNEEINRMPNMCPQNGECLTTAQIGTITSWINAGAPQ